MSDRPDLTFERQLQEPEINEEADESFSPSTSTSSTSPQIRISQNSYNLDSKNGQSDALIALFERIESNRQTEMEELHIEVRQLRGDLKAAIAGNTQLREMLRQMEVRHMEQVRVLRAELEFYRRIADQPLDERLIQEFKRLTPIQKAFVIVGLLVICVSLVYFAWNWVLPQLISLAKIVQESPLMETLKEFITSPTFRNICEDLANGNLTLDLQGVQQYATPAIVTFVLTRVTAKAMA